MSDYDVMVGFENEGHRHEPGEAVDHGQLIDEGFDESVIDNWLDIGVLDQPLTRSGLINELGAAAGQALIEAGFSSISGLPQTKEELVAIPGIGDVRADRILEVIAEREDG